MTGLRSSSVISGTVAIKQPDPLDHFDDRLDRDDGAAANPVEQREHPKPLRPLVGPAARSRREHDAAVVQDLGVGAAGGDDDERSDRRVAHPADEQLDAGRDLALDEDVAQPVDRTARGNRRPSGARRRRK